MKSILVPTDFSPEAHHAYGVALQIARQTDGHVTLLHVLEDIEESSGGISTLGSTMGGPGIDEIYPIKLMEATKRRLRALIAETQQLAAGVPVRESIKAGTIGEGILKAIQRYDADLVVLGTRGHGAVERFFRSSNTERLIRQAPCPVLTVKHQQAEFEVHTVVFPSDFTEEATQAVDSLRQVLDTFPDAKLHLLHVASGTVSQATTQQMHAFAQRAQLSNVQMEVVSAGSTVAGIEQYSQQVGADLVVIPTHVRSGLSSLFRTSIAEAVATHAFPPVLTYHLQ